MSEYKLVPKSIVDELAQFIRQVDGDNKMGAGSLADKICERFRVDAPAVQGELVAEEVTLFECVSCNHMYQGQVTRCDCMPEEQKFNRWLARPERAEHQPDVTQLVEALSALRGCIMETRGPDAHSALVLADAALAPYRKGACK